MGDWMHINSMSVLGPTSGTTPATSASTRQHHRRRRDVANITFIIDKKTGKVVWKLGPDYDATPELRAIGWIIGQHHCHMIPAGLRAPETS
jgi:hypothetical protein